MSSGLARCLALVWLAAVGCPAFAMAYAQESEPVTALQDSALEQQVRQVASSLRCPVCLNLSVEDSPNELARDMKRVIRERLAEGATPEDVRQYFVDRYGEWVLLTPKPEGINLALWLLPVLGLLAGGGLVWAAVRRWVRLPEDGAGPG